MNMGVKSDICLRFTGDGICREFNFNYEIFDEENLEVYLNNVVQEKGLIVLRDDINEGGRVIFEKAPELGDIITIIRKIPIRRTTDFTEGGPFRASKINHEFNYQLACIEQIDDKLNRVICKPPYMPENINLDLPEPVSGKSIIWGEDGKYLKNSEVSVDEITGYFDIKSEEAKISAEEAKTAYENICKVELYAKDWAIKNDGKVIECGEDIDYSSKYYALQAKESSEHIEQIVSNVHEAINDKSDKNFSNTNMKDYVTDIWNEGANWYRKYKSGWIEQGGSKIDSNAVITFNLPFKNTDFYVNFYCFKTSSSTSGGYHYYKAKTTTMVSPLDATMHGYWYACGYGV